MFRMRLGLPIAVLALAVSPRSAGAQADPAPPCWEEPLWWLPGNTETLIVAPGPFVIPAAKPGQPEISKALRFLPILPLHGLDNGFVRERITGLKVECAVEGSRRFTRPTEFGMMQYQ